MEENIKRTKEKASAVEALVQLAETDEEIKERYGSEEEAVRVAEMYLEIALKASILEQPLKGWSMKYTMPEKGSDKRKEFVAHFYDKYEAGGNDNGQT